MLYIPRILSENVARTQSGISDIRLVTATEIKGLKPRRAARCETNMHELDGQSLLVGTTDRISAFGMIMQEPIPYKGMVLNARPVFG